MPNELLSRDWMTAGSHSVLAIEMRRDETFPTPLVTGGLPYEAEAEQSALPIQSAGESVSSRGLQKKLYSALAGFAELASQWLGQLWVTSSPGVRAANMDPWTAKNQRRIRLIVKKYQGGLGLEELAELARLQIEVDAHVERVAPRSTDVIDDFAEHVRKLKERAAAKKGKMP
jgi:hypothetical protein